MSVPVARLPFVDDTRAAEPASGEIPGVATTAPDPLLDRDRLAVWAQRHLPGSGPLEVTRLAAGHSNITYLLDRPGQPRWVLRRPPAGPLLPTAHDVLREYRVLEILGRSGGARVSAVVAACEDPEVIGAPFYVMTASPGVVVRESLPAWLDDAAADIGEVHRRRRALGLDVLDALAEVHRVDPVPLIEAGIGRSEGYLPRQLRRWTGQRQGILAAVAAGGGRARELPDYDALRDWLESHRPDDVPAAVVHGDYKLDNVLVEGERVTSILDWEMATVGDPRADLGYLLSFWPEPGEAVPLATLVTAHPGFPRRDELVSRWAQGTGREPGDTSWFIALALWKLAILLEASYHRWLAGSSDDAFFAELDTGVPALLARAREVCGA